MVITFPVRSVQKQKFKNKDCPTLISLGENRPNWSWVSLPEHVCRAMRATQVRRPHDCSLTVEPHGIAELGASLPV
jgi:hypothetical protein